MISIALVFVCVFQLVDNYLADFTCLFAFGGSTSTPLVFVCVFSCLMAILLLVGRVCALLIVH